MREERESERETHVKRVVAVAARRAEREDLGPLVGSVDLEVGVRVLLFEDELHRLFDVDEELARLGVRLVCFAGGRQLGPPARPTL